MDADAESPLPASPSARGPIGRGRLDLLIARVSAGFSVLFAAQTIPVAAQQIGDVQPLWAAVFVPTLYGAIVAAVVAAVAARGVRFTQGLVAVVYLVGVLSWPLAIVDVGGAEHVTYWLYYLVTGATAMATVAFPLPAAVVYLVGVPTVMALVRIGSGAVAPLEGVLNSVFSILLGGVIVIIVTMLRQAASAVDAAQGRALAAYEAAVGPHAREAERVQVDSIVHDSVLTTLLAAAHAETPETRALATEMAARAVERLDEAMRATPVAAPDVDVAELARRIADAADVLPVPVDVAARVPHGRRLPAVAAEAVYAAAVQAMVNSVQHAGDAAVERWVAVRTFPDLVVEVEVGDAGRGFDPARLRGGRLGLRVSIVERVRSAGGSATVTSVVGAGTTILLRWPGERS